MVFKCVGHYKRFLISKENGEKIYFCRVFGVRNDPIEKNAVTDNCDGFSVCEIKVPVRKYDETRPEKGKLYKVNYTENGYLDEFEEVQS